MARRKEHWDLLNVRAQFGCYRRAYAAAASVARAKGCAIMIRHHGPRPTLDDPTRVNHYVWPDGRKDYKKDGDGHLIDVK